MSKSSFEAFLLKYPGPYSCHPGRDGVDETFEIYCDATHQYIYAAHYWEAKAEAKREALAVMLALEFVRRGFRLGQVEDVEMAKPPEVREFLAKHPAPYQCEFIESDFDPGFEIQCSDDDNKQAAYVRDGYHRHGDSRLVAEAIAYSLGLLSSSL